MRSEPLTVLGIDGKMGAMDWRSLAVNIVALLNTRGGRLEVRNLDRRQLESNLMLAIEVIDPVPGDLIVLDGNAPGFVWVRSDGRLFCELYKYGRLGFWKVVEGDNAITTMRLGEVASRIDQERRLREKEATTR